MVTIDLKKQNFICENKDIIKVLIKALFDLIPIRVPLQRIILNKYIYPAICEVLDNICNGNLNSALRVSNSYTDGQLKNFICNNKDIILDTINTVFNVIPIKIPFQNIILKMIIIPLINKQINKFCN